MKNFQLHYNGLKRLLHNESGLDKDSLRGKFEKTVENAQKDMNLLDFDDEDRDVIAALIYRIQRLNIATSGMVFPNSRSIHASMCQ